MQALGHMARLMPPAYPMLSDLADYRAMHAAHATNVDTHCSNCNVKLTATHRLKPSSNAKSHLGRITSIASLQSGD